MTLAKEEVLRKVLHIIFGACIPAGILYIPRWVVSANVPTPIPSWAWPVVILAAFMVLFVLVERLRISSAGIGGLFDRLFGSMLRKEESNHATGATYIVASSLICAVLFRKDPHIAAMAISAFIWGDAVAAIVGQSIGRVRIGSKTLEGSLGCFALCLFAFFVVYPATPGLLDAWGGVVPLNIVLVTSLCVTVLELFPVRVGHRLVLNDNLTVPVVSGLVMKMLHALA